NGSPDLAVEIVDDNDPPGAIEARVQQYLASGSTLVWVADPLYRRVIVYQPHGSFLSVGQNDALTGGVTLPGFSVTVGDFFRYR
ncbi:MAG TPA: Uma2 family endonuclease, partial [Candidatus Xenobia bacterium]